MLTREDFLTTPLIYCPTCAGSCSLREVDSDRDLLENYRLIGSGRCTSCTRGVVRFIYNTDNNQISVWNSHDECRYEPESLLNENRIWVVSSISLRRLRDLLEEPISHQENVFVVINGAGTEDCHIVQIFTQREVAASVLMGQRGGHTLSIQEHQCPLTCYTRPSKVFVVTVGSGKGYRIADITPDKRRATDIATSIGGSVSMHEALPSLLGYENVMYFKFFVNLEAGGSGRVQYIQSVYRREEVGGDWSDSAMVTHRRRYNSSLPHRLEVIATDERLGREISDQLSERFSAEDARLLFEYNVDYQLERINEQWEIKPCLLETVEESST